MFQGLKPEIEHPLRFRFHAGNIFHYFPAQAFLGLEKIVFLVVETIFIFTYIVKDLCVFAHRFTIP
jgi:hypothetical protein